MNQKEQLNVWYQTSEGVRFSQRLDGVLRSTIESIFGYNAAQLTLDTPTVLKHSPINYKINACQKSGQVLCNGSSLPFESESLDLIILAHSLECTSDPHAVLREVERVLVGEGSLIIIGLSPLSLSYAMSRLKEIKNLTHRYTSRKVCEWLDVLGFETSGGSKVPVEAFNVLDEKQSVSYRNKTLNILFRAIKGRGYYIHAKKRITRVTPISPPWYRKPKLIYSNDVEPVSNTSTPRVKHKPKGKPEK